MDATEANLTGVIVECGITDEALRDFIGTPTPTWLQRHGKTKLVIRENQVHDLVEVDTELVHLELVSDGFNDKFHFRAQACVDDRQRAMSGELHMSAPNRSNRGLVKGH